MRIFSTSAHYLNLYNLHIWLPFEVWLKLPLCIIKRIYCFLYMMSDYSFYFITYILQILFDETPIYRITCTICCTLCQVNFEWQSIIIISIIIIKLMLWKFVFENCANDYQLSSLSGILNEGDDPFNKLRIQLQFHTFFQWWMDKTLYSPQKFWWKIQSFLSSWIFKISTKSNLKLSFYLINEILGGNGDHSAMNYLL